MQSAIRAVSQAARDASKGALRRYGEITSVMRGEPDFVIIGAKRGGTTSLYNYLLEHPSIAPLFPGRQRIKGVHFFDSEFPRGPGWYRSHFPLEVGGRQVARPWVVPAITGEASPYYLFHPLAAQRLARRICQACKEPVEISNQALMNLGFKKDEVGTFTVYKGRGCDKCNNTGYKGRVGLVEVMTIDDELRDMILAGGTAIDIKRKAAENGMISLRRSGLIKIKEGITTIEEVVRETVL